MFGDQNVSTRPRFRRPAVVLGAAAVAGALLAGFAFPSGHARGGAGAAVAEPRLFPGGGGGGGAGAAVGQRQLISKGEPGALTKQQRTLADEMISVFENDTPEIQYGYIEDLGDGRGYTAGRAGFCTGCGDLVKVVQDYTDRVGDNPLAGYLPALRELATSGSSAGAVPGSDSHDGLDGLPNAWSKAAQDPAFRESQDRAVDEMYFNPAVGHAREVGLCSPLGIAIIYDTVVQHGDGEDPDGLGALIARTDDRAGGSPATGVNEREWLAAFLDVRADDLSHPRNPDPRTKEAWANSVARVAALRSVLDAHNDDLRPPLTINPYGTEHTLDAAA